MNEFLHLKPLFEILKQTNKKINLSFVYLGIKTGCCQVFHNPQGKLLQGNQQHALCGTYLKYWRHLNFTIPPTCQLEFVAHLNRNFDMDFLSLTWVLRLPCYCMPYIKQALLLPFPLMPTGNFHLECKKKFSTKVSLKLIHAKKTFQQW